MLFNSLQFAVFLPIVFAVYWILPNKYRWPLLLAASYYFYMSWNVKYVVLIFFTTLVSYFAALALGKTRSAKRKKAILWISLTACLGVLFVFKYFNFFTASMSQLFGLIGIRLHPMTLALLLPVGISFYTFQTLSYVIDVYRGDIEAERSFGIYATYVSFFPQLVAGPIERTKNLMPQLKAEHTFDYDQATYGLKLMAWGYFKKLCIADFVSVYVDGVFNDIYSYQGFALVLAAFFFTIQIYCDFSGYSDIARGTAKLLGIELTENFKSPYFSASIHEFWSRWHISLSTWFRDYVYIPLGGNRVSKARHYGNLLVTFLVSGLWHGANWTFVLWGGLHGLAQIAENVFGLRRKETKQGGLRWWLRALLVFCFAALAWVLFRAQTLNEAVYLYRHMFDGIRSPILYLFNGFSTTNGIGIGMSEMEFDRFTLAFILLAAHDFASLKKDVISWLSNLDKVLRWVIYLCLIWFAIALIPRSGSSEFVYFQF